MLLKIKLVSLLIVILLGGLCSCRESSSKKTISSRKSENQKVDSLKLLTRQIGLDPANSNLFKLRAGIYLKEGRIDPAFRDISKAIELNPENPENFLMLGDIYFVLGKVDNCLSSYKKAAKLEPGSEKPLLKLAGTLLMLQQFDKASPYIERAISMNQNSSQAFYFRGLQKMETGDTLSAITQLRIAVNLDSSNYDALMQAGSLLSSQHDTTAIDYFVKALQARPDNQQALYFVARRYQEMGQYDTAIGFYQKINSLYPANKMAYYNQGYIYLVDKREFENAITAFQQAIAIDPRFVESVYNLGRTYEALGRYKEAREQYQQALKLKTNYPLAVDGMNRLDRIRAKK